MLLCINRGADISLSDAPRWPTSSAHAHGGSTDKVSDLFVSSESMKCRLLK